LKNGFYDKIWALISVSIAAQLGTLPLTLYYFHQFPTYFLLTNLFIVPLSGLIIYAGLVLLIFSFWSFAATIIATVLNYLLFILNWLILHVEFLPGASIHGIWINIFETTCLLLMVLTMAIWIFNKNNKLIFIFLGVALALITSNAIRVFSDSHQNSLVVYNTPGHITLSFIQNNKLVLFADSSIIRNVEKASSNLIIANNIEKVYYYKNYNNGFRDTSFADVHIHWFAGKNLLLSFNNNKIVIIRDRKLFSYSCKKPQLVDYLFISEKLNSTFQDFDEYFKPEFIVIERSRKQKILANSGLVKKLKTQVIFIDQQGAFKADL
jgi:competence protein ComEC